MTKKKNSANNLNASIVRWMNFRGHFVWRNNTTGVFDPVRKVFRKNPNTERGVGDIIGVTSSGIHVEIETKKGRDTMSIFQISHGQKVKNKKGIYIEARDLDRFIEEAKALGL